MKRKSHQAILLSYAGHYKILTYLSWLLSILSTWVGLIPFWYIWKILDEVLQVAPQFSKATHVVSYGWHAVFFSILALLLYYSALLCSHRSAFRIATNIRKALLSHILSLPMGILERFGTGRLRRTILTSSSATETYLAHSLPDLAGLLATPIGLLVLLFAFDWRLGLLSLLPIVVGFVLLAIMMGSGAAKRLKEYQNALSDMSNEAVEYVRGIQVVKTFGQSIHSLRRFKDTIDRYEKWVIHCAASQRLPMVLFMTISNAVFAILIAGGIWLMQRDTSTTLLSNLLFYIIITPIIGTNLMKIMFMGEDSLLIRDIILRMDEVLQQKPLAQGTEQLSDIAKDIVIDNVSYSYDAHKKALDGLSLTIPAGKTIALVGPSGGGKSTLANLIARFFDPQEGSVRIGETDLRAIEKSAWMQHMAYVSQNSHLLKTSILENVRLGRPEASKEEVQQALIDAQCTDILEKLPQGIDTIIGSDGTFLSGGEKQRICIARAILKNAPYLILDEATAFADPENEVKLQQAFDHLCKDKTVIMIAHRLSSIQQVDWVYVLKEGRVVEEGAPQTLRAQNGLFTQMWDSYQHSVQWKLSKENL